MWKQLKKAGGPLQVGTGVLRDLRIYGSAQGIWVDKGVTGSVSPDGRGVAVSLFCATGSAGTRIFRDGVMYNYSRTARSTGRDMQEVNAVKNAGLLGLPLFFITATGAERALRDVRVGWVEDWDDASGVFLVVFGNMKRPIACVAEERGRLFPRTGALPEHSGSSVGRRASEVRFEFNTLKRCGFQCAVCNIAVPQLLSAVRLRGKRQTVSDDPTDGLLLCALHRAAYEAKLFDIDRDTLLITTPPNSPDSASLGIIGTSAGAVCLRGVDRNL